MSENVFSMDSVIASENVEAQAWCDNLNLNLLYNYLLLAKVWPIQVQQNPAAPKPTPPTAWVLIDDPSAVLPGLKKMSQTGPFLAAPVPDPPPPTEGLAPPAVGTPIVVRMGDVSVVDQKVRGVLAGDTAPAGWSVKDTVTGITWVKAFLKTPFGLAPVYQQA